MTTELKERLSWMGRVLSVQPRIRRTRSFDERSHTYLGYVLQVQGTLGGEERGEARGHHDEFPEPYIKSFFF
jgi:hypothetical protein